MRANAAVISAPIKGSFVQRIADGFAKVVERVRTYRKRRADVATLHSMSDRELKDIGLSRCDLHRVTSV